MYGPHGAPVKFSRRSIRAPSLARAGAEAEFTQSNLGKANAACVSGRKASIYVIAV